MIFLSLFNNSSEQISLDFYDRLASKALNFLKSATLPDQQDLEQLRKLDIRIGKIVKIALHTSSSNDYVIASENCYAIDVQLGQRKSIHLIVPNIDPKAIPSVNSRVAVLINLKPDCETGNSSSYLIQELPKTTETEPSFATIITPSELLTNEGKLLFSAEDFQPSPSNHNHYLFMTAFTIAVLTSLVLSRK